MDQSLKIVWHTSLLFRLKANRPHPRDYPHKPPWLQAHRQSLRTGSGAPCPNFEGYYLSLHSASLAPNIDGYVPEIRPQPLMLISDVDLDYELGPDLWPWPQSKVIGDKQRSQNTFICCVTFDLQPWPTFPWGRPSYQKSRSWVKQFIQESAHRQTNK